MLGNINLFLNKLSVEEIAKLDTNKDGQRVYTTDVVVEEQEFAESKSASESNAGFAPAERPAPSSAAGDGFMNIPDGIDEELPFN